MSNLVDRPGGLFFFKLSQKKRMSSFVKSVERLGGLSFFKLSHKGSVETNVKLCQICQALWGADFPSICRKKGPQARLTDLTNLTSHFPGPGKKVPDPIPGSSEGAPLGLLVARRVGPEDCQVCQICQTAPGLFFFKMSPRWEDCQLCQIWQTVLGGCFSSNCHKKRECQVLSNPSSDSEACLSSNCHTKGLWRRMSSFVKSVKRSGGLIFLQFVKKKARRPV